MGIQIRKVTVRLFFKTIVSKLLTQITTSLKWSGLNEEDFDPSPSLWLPKTDGRDPFILHSQEWIQWADHLIFVYPIWWSSTEPHEKGWINRVFTPGIAYSANDQGSLSGITQRQTIQRGYLKENSQYLCDLHGLLGGTRSFRPSTFR